MNILSDFKGGRLLYKIYGGIGDLLWRTPLIRAIKEKFSNSEIYVNSQGPHWKLIFKNNPYIDGLVDVFDISEYDKFIEDELCPHVRCHYAFELDAVDALSVWSGIEIKDRSYVYIVENEEEEWAKEFLRRLKKPIIGFQLRASSNVRNWDFTEQYRLIRMLRNIGTVILFDSQPSSLCMLDGVVSMCGGYNIREVAVIIKNLDCLVTPDTSALHFAGHFKVPTVAYFAGTDPKCRVKYYTTVKVIMQKNKPNCWPCWFHGHKCPRLFNSNEIVPLCIRDIKAEHIFKEVLKCLKKEKEENIFQESISK